MPIKKYSSFNESSYQMMKEIEQMCEKDRYQSPQIETTDKSYNEELQRYLWEIAEIKSIDALGGTEAPSGMRRYGIDGKIGFEEIIHMAPTGIACGIKVVKYPIGSLMEYQQWPGGYIEGFIRMDSDDPRFGEYFVWTYMKMQRLQDILEKFEGKLEIL
jgi:hypothetical protein